MSLALTRGRLAALAGVSLSLSLAGLAVGGTGSSALAPVPTFDLSSLGHLGTVGNGGDESKDLQTVMEQHAAARTAPYGTVPAGAYSDAWGDLSGLTPTGSATELTTKPYNSDDVRYRDPEFSNSQGGSGNVAGRITGLALDVAHGKVYAAGADGGVFRGTLG
jgi:hypothetical protein